MTSNKVKKKRVYDKTSQWDNARPTRLKAEMLSPKRKLTMRLINRRRYCRPQKSDSAEGSIYGSKEW